jgi:cupin 2 domain-containing protein
MRSATTRLPPDMKPPNLLHALPAQLPSEIVDVLVCSAGMRIERIVSRGHCSPEGFWYQQTENEWVTLLAGEARLCFDDGSVLHMTPGDHVEIRAGQRHRVEWTAPDVATVWLAVFYGPSGPIPAPAAR